MTNSRPVGSLGGGGWEPAGHLPGAALGGENKESKSKKEMKDKVLTDMYEMFLDSIEPEIISNVVGYCNFNHKKSMDALLEMCGSKSQTSNSPEESKNPSRNEKRPLTLCLQMTNNTAGGAVRRPEILTSQASKNLLLDEKKQPPPLSSILLSGARAHDQRRHMSHAQQENDGAKKRTQDLFKNDKMTKIRWYIENGQKIMILMRGCSGSGKSSLARGIIQSYKGDPQEFVFSTDDFFVKNGVYKFDPMCLSDAHHWNQTRVLSKVRAGWSPVIVDNTNTQMWEMTVYVNIAINNGYAIEILEPETPWFTKLSELAKRNQHGVPRDKIKLMLERYEFGITAEGLISSTISSTGAKYTNIPPQPAEKTLLSNLPPRSEKQDPPRSMNQMPVSAKREQHFETQSPSSESNSESSLPSANFLNSNKFFNSFTSKESPKTLLANCSTNSEVLNESKLKDLCGTTPNLIPTKVGEDGFYFGSSAQSQSLDVLASTSEKQDLKSQGRLSNSSIVDEGRSPFSVLSETEFGETNKSQKVFCSTSTARQTELVMKKSTENDANDSDSFKEFSANEKNNPDVVNLSLLVNSLSVKDACENKSVMHSEIDSRENLMEAEVGWENEISSKNAENSSSNIKRQEISSYWTDGNKSHGDINATSKSADGCEVDVQGVPNENTNVFHFSAPKQLDSDELKRRGNSSNLKFSSVSDPLSDGSVRKEGVSNSCSFSSFTDLVHQNSKHNSIDWMGTASWEVNEETKSRDNVHQNPLPKPPRSFSMKSIDDYCNSMKEIKVASEIHPIGWLPCENSSASWQPIDKIQEEVFKKEKSLSPSRVINVSQRPRFNEKEVATNTHHSDFCILSNNSSSSPVGIVVLEAHDRDINEGRSIIPNKIPLKLMLDKGTLTENDFVVDLKKESKQEKIKELTRLFPNISFANIKELLKQCNWDVNYVSNILLDDTETLNSLFVAVNVADDSNDADSDVESASQENQGGQEDSPEVETVNEDPVSDSTSIIEAEEVKRHIEQSIDFSEGYYSPHTLAIKNFRRGLREGAIPKSNPSLSNEDASSPPESSGILPESDRPQNKSESSDGCEHKLTETLEFVISYDFIQQLVDKFGGPSNVTNLSPVVKLPIGLARQIYDAIFSGNSDEEDLALKLQCEEDERIARQLYEEMRHNSGGLEDSSPPQLREIMDMELAQAIYKADVDSLSQNSQETMANILAKRLLEDNYKYIDKKVLHDIFASCNNSFEDSVKTLQEALATDDKSHELASRERPSALQSSTQVSNRESTPKKGFQSIEESLGIENPWKMSDPAAYYKECREKAEQLRVERDEMYRKASDAFKRKERSVAAYYSKLGELHMKNYQHASAMAATALAVNQTNSTCDTCLDLHSFKVAEALMVFDLFVDHHIRTIAERGVQQLALEIITGRGIHSVNGKPRIKPAIVNRSKQRKLRHDEFILNPGAVRVYISMSSSLSYQIAD